LLIVCELKKADETKNIARNTKGTDNTVNGTDEHIIFFVADFNLSFLSYFVLEIQYGSSFGSMFLNTLGKSLLASL
jgi:hypothetical protein